MPLNHNKYLATALHYYHRVLINIFSYSPLQGGIMARCCDSDSEFEEEQEQEEVIEVVEKPTKKAKLSKTNAKTKAKAKESTTPKAKEPKVKEPKKYAPVPVPISPPPPYPPSSIGEMGPKCIRLGLCCINNALKDAKPQVFCSRGMTLASVQKKGLEALKELCIANVRDLIPLLQWNEQNGIKCLRVSSDMFPHISNHRNPYPYWLDFAQKELAAAGEIARRFGHRITMHPGQYDVIGSPDEATFQNTLTDLYYHAQVLDMMGVGKDGVIVIHGGGLYGDKAKAIDRWCANFQRLPEAVKRRLVIENDERCFSPKDCLEISERTGVPVVFDNHHFDCYVKTHLDEDHGRPEGWIGPCLESFRKRGIRPKFHISEQRPDARLGTHSDFIEVMPQYYLEIPERYGMGVDIMIEAKAKEAAIMQLYEKYPQLRVKKE